MYYPKDKESYTEEYLLVCYEHYIEGSRNNSDEPLSYEEWKPRFLNMATEDE